ncbi:tRNA-uridine aminocarboxypropyltransferase [Pseudoduganella sp. OTU4001]|uniref:tRNA-uridine aminocarboxypropyltransferase n=1 Tax=Pseudoduganella sp. OTU4001 TaxID=3043854 RepID=UPI00313BE91D
MNTLLRRPMCATCLRPAATCICHWVAPVASAVDILILQHPMEVANAKGSARLLHLCLPGSRIESGEQFGEAALRTMLGRNGRQPVLLYPDTPGDRSLGIAPPPQCDPGLAPENVQLVVLDATWRKSRKMLYLNPLLQALPRLPLRDTPPSHYLIRKAHAPDQLSTLEASCYALAQLEGDEHRYDRVIAAFDGFVAQQQALATRGGQPS